MLLLGSLSDIFYKSFKTWNLPLQKSYCDHSNQPSGLQKIFYFLGPQGQRKYFLHVNDYPPPSLGVLYFLKLITTKQDSVDSFVLYSSFVFPFCVYLLSNFLYFFSLSTFTISPSIFSANLKKFSGTKGPVVRHIMQPFQPLYKE